MKESKGMAIFIILILSFHENEVTFHFLVFFSIFLQRFIVFIIEVLSVPCLHLFLDNLFSLTLL